MSEQIWRQTIQDLKLELKFMIAFFIDESAGSCLLNLLIIFEKYSVHYRILYRIVHHYQNSWQFIFWCRTDAALFKICKYWMTSTWLLGLKDRHNTIGWNTNTDTNKACFCLQKNSTGHFLTDFLHNWWNSRFPRLEYISPSQIIFHKQWESRQ